MRVLRDPLLYVEVDPDTECWYWPFKASTGFGPYLSFFVAVFGEPPGGMDVFHQCRGGRQGCIRPKHLDIAPSGTRIRHVPDPAIGLDRRPEFARRLRAEREARRITREQFARELGVAPALYANWEEGSGGPAVDVYHDISRKMGWDGELRRFSVVMGVERVIEARSAGEAAQTALSEVEVDGRPVKAKVVRVALRP